MGEEMCASTSHCVQQQGTDVGLFPSNRFKYLHLDPKVDVVMNEKTVANQRLRECLFCGRFGNLHVYHGHEKEVWFCKTAITELIGLGKQAADEYLQSDLFMCFTCYDLAAGAITCYLEIEKRRFKLIRIQENTTNKIEARIRPPGVTCTCFDLLSHDPRGNSDFMTPGEVEMPTNHIRRTLTGPNQDGAGKNNVSILPEKGTGDSGLLTTRPEVTLGNNDVSPCNEVGKSFSHGDGYQHLIGLFNNLQTSSGSPN